MQITDTLTLDASGLSRTKDGYLVGEARVSRAFNTQQYRGSEIGLTGDDAGRMFGVYRDPEVVFDEKAMLSLAGRPVTRGHPESGVTADNWRELAKGQMGGVIRRDGDHVVASMAIMDAAAVAEIEGGARSLSAGYTVGIIADEGTAPDGTAYQYRQSGELRFNHVAYLPANNPRAGNTRIGDDANAGGEPKPLSNPKEVTMTDALKTVVLGDQAVQVAAADASAIEKFKTDQAKQLTDAIAAHDKAIALKDAAIAKVEAERDAALAKVLTDAALDAKVTARADLVAKARAIAPALVTVGLADAAIRKAAVTAKLGDAALAGKSDAYIDARFEMLTEDVAKADPVADALKNGNPALVTDAATARAQMIKDIQSPTRSAAA